MKLMCGKKISFVLFFMLLCNCTVRTSFKTRFISSNEKVLSHAADFVTKTEHPVFVKSCFTKAGYPFYWESEADAVIAKAIRGRPLAVGLLNAEFTSEVFVLGFYNHVCLGVRGQPAYAEASSVTPQ